MKIALAQLNYHTGNFKSNSEKIIKAITKAQNQGAELVVFAELAICGYPPRDFLEFSDFVHQCKISIQVIAKYCKNIAAIIGSPVQNPHPSGKKLFNSACFLYEGKIMETRHKTLLPTYDIFDEYRYFEPNKEFSCIHYKGKKIALTICEDLWNIGNHLYTANPMDELNKEKPDFIINISASPYSYMNTSVRKHIFITNAKMYQLPLFYVNHAGAQTELIFDGGSMVIDKTGNIINELKLFEEDLQFFDSDDLSLYEKPKIEKKGFVFPEFTKIDYECIHDALVLGIKDYFQKLGFSKATLGLSGGIDSAVTMILAARALGKENVFPYLLPSKFSSEHSISDSIELCKNTGILYEEIKIQNVVNEVEKTLHRFFNTLEKDVTEENIQARTRAILLMAMCNKFDYILLNTSNKSENAVGYGTLYGDMCGGLSVLGDVYKTQVYGLAEFINSKSKVIPENIFKKPPSAELKPDQKDTDSLPEYDVLDKVLFHYIELRKSPKELIELGFDVNLVTRVLKMVNSSEYKRYQTPPILRISGKAFGMGRRMPIVGKYLS